MRADEVPGLGNGGGGLCQGHDGGKDDKDGSGGELHGELEWVLGGWVVGILLDVVAMERRLRMKVELLLYSAFLP